ncbi:hypothetical protein ACLKA6_002748 [Drosophila palustris]
MERQHATTSSHVPQSLPCLAPSPLPLFPSSPACPVGNGKAAAKTPRTLTLWKAQKKSEINKKRGKRGNNIIMMMLLLIITL